MLNLIFIQVEMETADESAAAASVEQVETQEQLEEDEVRSNITLFVLQKTVTDQWTENHCWMIVSSMLIN